MLLVSIGYHTPNNPRVCDNLLTRDPIHHHNIRFRKRRQQVIQLILPLEVIYRFLGLTVHGEKGDS